LAPHLVSRGADNDAWLGAYKGMDLLYAEGKGIALALGCSAPWRARSVGFVGSSDGWQDFSRHFALPWNYEGARGGMVALPAEIDLAACNGDCVVALGFGRRAEEAAHRVVASLHDGFDAACGDFTAAWRRWQQALLPLDGPRDGNAQSTY